MLWGVFATSVINLALGYFNYRVISGEQVMQFSLTIVVSIGILTIIELLEREQ